MSDTHDDFYTFVFRGLLTEEVLDKAGRKSVSLSGYHEEDIAKSLSIDRLDPDLVSEGKKMAVVYTAISAFENSIRNLIVSVLLDQKKENWWKECVSDKIRKKASDRIKEEENTKWHSQRGQDPIFYLDIGDLAKIFQQNWEYFEPYIKNLEWAKNIIEVIEKSRNVIMHGGLLEQNDIERIGIYLRDWVNQVGA
ncbi:MAG: hypothetical protein IIA63_08880 [Nitrospinae bacterium]|nr:hypothetical protein [Nitrospinota bacterium]